MGQMVIYSFYLCCVSKGESSVGVSITLWNKPCKTARMNQHAPTHHHGWMGMWTGHSFSLGSCSLANLNRSQKVLQVCVIQHSSNWVVSHFVCPLKVSYYEEGPEIKKQVVSFVWIKACQLSFEELTKCLASVPILVRPDFSKPLILEVD